MPEIYKENPDHIFFEEREKAIARLHISLLRPATFSRRRH